MNFLGPIFNFLVFFDLCDVDKSGTITKKELYDVLKRSMAYEEEKAKLKRTSKIDKLSLKQK